MGDEQAESNPDRGEALFPVWGVEGPWSHAEQRAGLTEREVHRSDSFFHGRTLLASRWPRPGVPGWGGGRFTSLTQTRVCTCVVVERMIDPDVTGRQVVARIRGGCSSRGWIHLADGDAQGFVVVVTATAHREHGTRAGVHADQNHRLKYPGR